MKRRPRSAFSSYLEDCRRCGKKTQHDIDGCLDCQEAQKKKAVSLPTEPVKDES